MNTITTDIETIEDQTIEQLANLASEPVEAEFMSAQQTTARPLPANHKASSESLP